MKKNFVPVILVAIFILLCTGCGKGYTHLEPAEALEKMKSEENFLIVDVRTPEEFERRHISNAILVPIDEIRKGNLEKLPDKNQTLFIYCWTGRRAEDSAVILAERGYTRIYEFGGLVSWIGATEGSENRGGGSQINDWTPLIKKH